MIIIEGFRTTTWYRDDRSAGDNWNRKKFVRIRKMCESSRHDYNCTKCDLRWRDRAIFYYCPRTLGNNVNARCYYDIIYFLYALVKRLIVQAFRNDFHHLTVKFYRRICIFKTNDGRLDDCINGFSYLSSPNTAFNTLRTVLFHLN